VGRVVKFGKPEICQLEVEVVFALRIEQDVFGLKVPVTYFLLVHVSHTQEYLMDNLSSFFLSKPPHFDNSIIKFSSFHQPIKL
jgi:hypothetical protein